MKSVDVVIIGAGAAGLMCAIEAAKRGRTTWVIDHANKVGKKILMSGGGRCNFTNYQIEPAKYLSNNPHFVKSALSRYTQWDFIALVEKHGIAYHEKKQGQLFCDHKSKDILDMLLSECAQYGVQICLKESIVGITKEPNHFVVKSNVQTYHCESLVVATGGLSIPTLGASPFGYKVAEQFDLLIHPTRAGLVPFTLQPGDLDGFSALPGTSQLCRVSVPGKMFYEHMLFTHRGLSGPAMLQISNYWDRGDTLCIDWLPDIDMTEVLKCAKQNTPNMILKKLLNQYFPKNLTFALFETTQLEKNLQSFSNQALDEISNHLHAYSIKPNGTEGYRTAEVTLGGVDCDQICSKTLMAKKVPGLYFIGEVLDVTGWLGGYNFQWAWSSGWAAGQVV